MCKWCNRIPLGARQKFQIHIHLKGNLKSQLTTARAPFTSQQKSCNKQNDRKVNKDCSVRQKVQCVCSGWALKCLPFIVYTPNTLPCVKNPFHLPTQPAESSRSHVPMDLPYRISRQDMALWQNVHSGHSFYLFHFFVQQLAIVKNWGYRPVNGTKAAW